MSRACMAAMQQPTSEANGTSVHCATWARSLSSKPQPLLTMVSKEENELLTRTGPGTPGGDLLRRYWIPALLSWELPEPDCAPVRLKLLGENLVAFRDTAGQVGILDELCPHRCASLFLGRNE